MWSKQRTCLVTAKHILSWNKIVISLPAHPAYLDRAANNKLKKSDITISAGGMVWDFYKNRFRTEIETQRDGKPVIITPSDSTDVAAIEIKYPIQLIDTDGIFFQTMNIGNFPQSFFAVDSNYVCGSYVFMYGFPQGIGAMNNEFNPQISVGNLIEYNPTNPQFYTSLQAQGGYSGSPVFILNNLNKPNQSILLAGIHTGHGVFSILDSNIPSFRSEEVKVSEIIKLLK